MWPFKRKLKPTAIVHIDDEGTPLFMFNGGVDFFIVDERAPYDRVYRMTVEVPRDEVLRVLGNSPVGHMNDDRWAGAKAVIEEALFDEPRLTVVPKDDPSP
jgi:hypothetical protein